MSPDVAILAMEVHPLALPLVLNRVAEVHPFGGKVSCEHLIPGHALVSWTKPCPLPPSCEVRGRTYEAGGRRLEGRRWKEGGRGGS